MFFRNISKKHRKTHVIESLNGTVPKKYIPPLLGNGKICFLADHMGSGTQTMIWWAGRRYNDPLRRLIPFGYFKTIIKINNKKIRNEKRTYWKQELNVENGLLITKNIYGQLKETNTLFVHHDYNLILINKKVRDVYVPFRLALYYVLHGTNNNDRLPFGMTIYPKWNAELNILEIPYVVHGFKKYEGIICIFSDKKVSYHMSRNRFEISTEISSDEDITFCI
ncbi:MAG: hypothetical protein DRJ41_05170, partial [Thermoprotei archaeon]